ncbi:hypothetical protein [Streptomyces sp. H27-S2]|uniref:hypothetical protein n=1 Tax=Streptomyces antarcticus TaxID=2996458 RepID=UPI00226F59CA|nr:hypothetical protein [Streptomyces sp. H27-S2]MCY0953294.1 hypothetical protein [Streptomyces sp. H27-S2]
MDKQVPVGAGALVMGLVVLGGSGFLAREAAEPDHVFGRASAAHPVFARVMPLIAGTVMTLMGVLVLTGVLGAG